MWNSLGVKIFKFKCYTYIKAIVYHILHKSAKRTIFKIILLIHMTTSRICFFPDISHLIKTVIGICLFFLIKCILMA